MNDSIFFHEDFYRQIELIPEENYFKTQSSLDNDMPSYYNLGLPILKTRNEHLIKTEDKKIDANDLLNSIREFANSYFPIVKTGYGSQIEIKKSTVAVGYERLAVFIENKDNIVKNVWICQSNNLPKNSLDYKIVDVLNILGMKFNFILIDWDEEAVIRLSSKRIIIDYLNDVFGFPIKH
jgi:hypothetical protein